MSIQEYEFHPYASVLPMLGTVELNDLAADIQANGLRAPITLLDGKILDGRNRYKACQIVKVEPRFRDFNGEGDPVDFIVSVNVKRRHLNSSQKALVMAKVLDLPRGNPKLKSDKSPANPKSAQNAELRTVAQAAKEIEVSPRTVGQAKQVLREAPKETVKQVERGEKSVATAVKEIKEAKAKTQAAKEERLDKTGYPIPDAVSADWNEAESFRATLNALHKIKVEIEKAITRKDRIYRFAEQSAVIDLQNAWRTLQQIIPYAVCPACQGRTKSKCSACKGMGYVPEFGYKHWFAKEVIELREKAIRK